MSTNAMTISIKVFDDTPDTVQANFNNSLIKKFINNKKIIPGELNMVFKNALNDVDAFVNLEGHVVISSEDAKNYSLDNRGHLIYTVR